MFNRYYENELANLKDLAVEFARANPALAPMLAGPSADPDVERLLEGVAFLTGLTRQKLDDEFPEIIQELANILFPHYLRAIPATTLVGFSPKGALMETAPVAAGTELASAPVDGTVCRFRTTQQVDVQPVMLRSARLVDTAGDSARIRLDFQLNGIDLSQWPADSLRLFLGAAYADASKLFLLLNTEVAGLSVRTSGGDAVRLPLQSLRPAGFDTELLPYPSNAFPGYRFLQEFFVMPEKFLFVDIHGLDILRQLRGAAFELVIDLKQRPAWMPDIGDDSFLLNVAPAINLFSHGAVPISLTHRQTDYRVQAEASNPQHFQIHSIDSVQGYRQGVAQQRVYTPFGLLRHGQQDGDGGGADELALTYHSTLRPVTVGRGSEVYLSIALPAGDTPVEETLSIGLTCTNRNLPESLKYGDIRHPTSTSPERLDFLNIRPVRPSRDAPAGEALLWRLLSHISMNFLSLANADNLRTLLALYIFSERQGQGDAANRRRVAGIEHVSVEAEMRLVGRHMMRGQRIRIRCRPDHYAGIGDLYLFGCILDRFLGVYAGINAYTRLDLEDTFTEEVFQWPPRLGQQKLL